MTAVTYLPGFSNLNHWPGKFFEGNSSSALINKTATSAVIKHGSTHDFAGFSVKFTGTGFTYSGSTVTDGTITGVTILDPVGAVLMKFTKIASTSVGSDFASIAGYILGLDSADGRINPDPMAAWSHLLSTNDTITGTEGRDRAIVGFDVGNDTYNMLGGDDRMQGGIGNDTYNGGTGFDSLSFSETTYGLGAGAFRGIVADMTLLTVKDCWGGTDKLDSIEDIQGSRFKDRFIGSDGEDQFSGLAGRDSFDGGGSDYDRVYYYDDKWNGGLSGITADLTAGTIRDGFGNLDTVVNIEGVIGTEFNDTFIGSVTARDWFSGEAGVDSYDGRDGQFDRIDFGWTFSDFQQHGIRVDLSKATGQIMDDGFGNVETAINIEQIVGTSFDDVIKGNSASNMIAGRGGQDTMTGSTGADRFAWWDLDHFNGGDIITDFNTANDRLSFDTNATGIDINLRFENDLSPSSAQSTFLFDPVSHTLYWDSNGSDAGGRYAIVVLNGVNALTAANFDLY